MDSGDVGSRYVTALRSQSKAASHTGTLPCPFPDHQGRSFQNINQLFDHVKTDHGSEIEGMEPRLARSQLKQAALKLRAEQTSEATAGDRSSPDIATLTIKSTNRRQQSPPTGNKRPAEPGPLIDAEFSRKIPYTVPSERSKPKPRENRLFDPRLDATTTQSSHQIREPPGRSVDANKTVNHKPPVSTNQSTQRVASRPQPGLIELQRYDPGLLMQPDSRPISQEQLASEVKSIYAGLKMVETKCMQVHLAQTTATRDHTGTNPISNHWEALIALHRTLLHEHHDFFLASQHPSASPSLRQLADKYAMPARMWKHGIHSILELLRHHLPQSIEYMLAFIYLAYQMMALLYETVPAYVNTWIECLGDLGRYRMAIEDEDIRDRETWAGVARTWYTKAADNNPDVGRLYHHLAVLARSNPLQQLYYFARSLTSVNPFDKSKISILTLLDPVLGRFVPAYSHALPIDTNFIKSHGLLFRKLYMDEFENTKQEFIGNLDDHIGRVTTKWKKQGVYTAVTNIAGELGYGLDGHPIFQVFLNEVKEKKDITPVELDDTIQIQSPADQQALTQPLIQESSLSTRLDQMSKEPIFKNAKSIKNETLALALRRIGDKNVLPHVHVMLSYMTTLASNKYVSFLLAEAPWVELAAFLNALIKTERQSEPQLQTQNQDIDVLLTADVFPGMGERADELPLPDDYLIRGLIWAHNYFPENWFEREHDVEERYLELASTVRNRMERVLRLGFQLTKHSRWMTYETDKHIFSVI